MRISAVRPILVSVIVLSALLLACADDKQEEGLDDDERDQTAQPSRARERADLTDAPTPAAATEPPTPEPTAPPTNPPTAPPTAPPPVVTAAPAPIATLAPAPIMTQPPAQSCHPSYQGACLNPSASDYDCAGGSGNGPYYTGQVTVVGPDVFDLDRDGDGYGCE